jgi:hypothetical protein
VEVQVWDDLGGRRAVVLYDVVVCVGGLEGGDGGADDGADEQREDAAELEGLGGWVSG